MFRWQWLWGRLANWFGVEAAGFDGTIRPLETEMAGDEALWREMAKQHGLVEPDLTRSRQLGFTAYQVTEDFFTGLFAQLRADKLIP